MFLSSPRVFHYLGISSSYVKVIVELPVPEPPGLRTRRTSKPTNSLTSKVAAPALYEFLLISYGIRVLLENASFTLRVVKYLHRMPQLPVKFMTLIHLLDGWLILVKMKSPLNTQHSGDFQAFFEWIGNSLNRQRVNMLFGFGSRRVPIDVMRRYQVVVVSHGSPDCSKIEAFRHQFTRLGFCPETLAENVKLISLITCQFCHHCCECDCFW